MQNQQLKEEANRLVEIFSKKISELAKLFADESKAPLNKQALSRCEHFFDQMWWSDFRESPVFARFVNLVNEKGLLARMTEILVGVQEAGKSFQGSGCFITRCFLGVFANYSDKSLEFCQNLSKQEAYFKVFYPKLLSSQDAKNVTMDNVVGDSIYSAIAAVYNCYYQNDSAIFSRLSQYELVACTQPYLECKTDYLSTLALILIAFAVDEKNSDVFLGAKKNIAFLIRNLDSALSSVDRKSIIGSSFSEAANCVKRLALNDKNKDLLIELDILPVVRQMLNSKNDKDVTEGIEILLQLSFREGNVKRIKSEFQQILDKLNSIKQWRDSKELQGLMIQINGLSAGMSKPTGVAKKSFKVMISYNHGSKDLVERLYDKLVEAKVEVWVDFNRMKSGSVYDQLAEGVENSSILIMCITRLYSESSYCRLEAQYAHELKKSLIPVLMEPNYRPTGWLGLLTGGAYRYDLSESNSPLEGLVKELLSATENPSGGHSEVPIRATLVHQPPPQSTSLSVSSKSIFKWDKNQVEAWCRENQLTDVIGDRRLTGVVLQFLVNTLARSPEYFGRVMEKYFGFIDIEELAKFVTALEELRSK